MSRVWRVLLATGCVLLMTLGLARYLHAQSSDAEGGVVTDPFGVQLLGGVFAVPGSDDPVKAREVGASWVRVDLAWSRLQPNEGDPIDWSPVDAGFARLAELGLKPIVTVFGIPQWAATEHPLPYDNPAYRYPNCGPVREDKMGAYLAFLRELVRRYSRPPYNVKYWELYNEPDKIHSQRPWINLGGCFGEIWYDEYVRMLREAYRVIKEEDPNSYVLIGGVAHDWFYWPAYGQNGVFDPFFLDEVIGRRRGGDYFDFMNFHTYREFAYYWRDYGPDILGKYAYMKEQMRIYGYPNKPLLITEAGARSYDPYHPEVNETSQAAYVLQLFARILTISPDRPFIWYTIRDVADSNGLLRNDGSPKPAFYVFRYGVQQFTGARYLGPTDDYGNTIEGYRYERRGKEFWVLWYKDAPYPEREISVPFTQVRVRNMLGTPVATIVDGDANDRDGQVNGRIRLGIPHEPVYLDDPTVVEWTPTPTPTPTATPTPTPTPTPMPTPTRPPLDRHWFFPWSGRQATQTTMHVLRLPHVPQGRYRVAGHLRYSVAASPTPTPWPTPTPTLTSWTARLTVGRPGVWGWWPLYVGITATFILGTVVLLAHTWR